MGKLLSYILFFIVAIQLLGCGTGNNKMPDLKESFSFKDSRPFGTAITFNIFKNAYKNKNIEFIKKDFSENYQWDYDTSSLYVNISANYYVNEYDATRLLDFVYNGNTAFIAAENIDSILLNKMFCKQTNIDYYSYNDPEKWTKTGVKFNNYLNPNLDSFSYFYKPFTNAFTEINDNYSRVVSYTNIGGVHTFVFLWGKGRLYFISEPRVFSNYFVLTNNNYLYVQKTIQMLPTNPQNVYWDNFYLSKNYPDGGKAKDFSTLSTIMKYPALKYAFFIALLLLILFIFFNGKRKQRVVPVIPSTPNNSIAFAEAIAGLYLSKNNNRVIADKIITYFNEHIRTKYFINKANNEDSFADILSRKSGVPVELTNKIDTLIKVINKSTTVSNEQLLQLNNIIEQFLKHKT